MPDTMYCSGMPSGLGFSGCSQASVQSLRSIRAGLPVNDRLRTVSRLVALAYASCWTAVCSASSTISHCGTGPRALRTKGQRRGDLLATADAAGREHRHRRDLLDDLRPEHDRADLAAVSARLAALGDDDVDSGVGVLASLGRRTAQRGDLATGRGCA